MTLCLVASHFLSLSTHRPIETIAFTVAGIVTNKIHEQRRDLLVIH